MTTGDLVKRHREAAGLSQRELAAASGVPFSTLFKIEQGSIAEPKLVTITRIAAALGRTCGDFVPPEGPPAERPPARIGRPKKPAAPSPPKPAANSKSSRGKS